MNENIDPLTGLPYDPTTDPSAPGGSNVPDLSPEEEAVTEQAAESVASDTPTTDPKVLEEMDQVLGIMNNRPVESQNEFFLILEEQFYTVNPIEDSAPVDQAPTPDEAAIAAEMATAF